MWNQTDRIGLNEGLVEAPFYARFMITRPTACVNSCYATGAIDCARDTLQFGYIEMSKIGGKYAFAPFSSDVTTNDGLTTASGVDSASVLYSYRHECRDVPQFRLTDCCITDRSGGLVLRNYLAPFAVFGYSASSGSCPQQRSAILAFLYFMHVKHAEHATDTRTNIRTAPSEGVCVIAFDGTASQPERLTRWSARDDAGAMQFEGPLDVTCTDCRVRVVLPCREDLPQLSWTLATDLNLNDWADIYEVLSTDGPPAWAPPPTCDPSAFSTLADLTDEFAGTLLEHGVNVRILTPAGRLPCEMPDPPPADDATALMLAALSGATSLPCLSTVTCIDMR